MKVLTMGNVYRMLVAVSMICAAISLSRGSFAAQRETISSDDGTNRWGPRSGNFQLAIAIVGSDFAPNRAVPVRVSIKNAGPQTEALVREFALADDRILIHDAARKLVPTRPNVTISVHGNAYGWNILTLGPSQVQTETIDLNLLYSFAPGEYTVEVARPVVSPEERPIGNPVSQSASFVVAKI